MKITSRNLNIALMETELLFSRGSARALFAILTGLFLMVATGPLSSAQPACAELGCNCEIAVGLIGQVQPFSAIHVDSQAQCLSFCKDSSLHWDRQNLSTTCSYKRKTILKNEIGLLDVNFADCRIDGRVERTSQRDCRRNCAQLSQNPQQPRQGRGSGSEATRECLWGGVKITKGHL